MSENLRKSEDTRNTSESFSAFSSPETVLDGGNSEETSFSGQPVVTGRDISTAEVLSEEELCAEIMSPEQLAESREYGRISLRYSLLDRAVDLLFLGLMAFLFTKPLIGWLVQVFPFLSGSGVFPTIGLTAALMTCLTFLHAVISFPLSFFNGWVIEKRFGLSNLTPFHWFRRYLLQLLLVFVLNLFLMTAFLFLIRLSGSLWWAVVSVLFFLFSMVLGCLVPVLVMPLFYRVEKLENESLMERFLELTRSTTLRLTGIYRLDLSIETSKANAMLAGLGTTRRVLLGDTLLKNFTDDEIIAVFAHEVGHHVHRHILKLMSGMFFASFAIFWLADLALRFWLGGSAFAVPDYAHLPVWTIPFFLFVMSIIGMFLEPFQNAVSRKFERQADTYALKHCGSAGAMRSAFIKLAVQNKADPFPSKWEVFWLHSHPAIGERIQSIR
ncbi:MAG: M48 family metallopeptidase [Planctomycetia bacterium]|nr:M48 family metallopeptidase [Planctomycetia bacterium]